MSVVILVKPINRKTSSLTQGKKPRERNTQGQTRFQFSAPRVKRPIKCEKTSANAKVVRIEKHDDDVELADLFPDNEDTKNEPVTNEDILKEIKLSNEVLLNSMQNMKEYKKIQQKETQ